jgi:hypothetical protein
MLAGIPVIAARPARRRGRAAMAACTTRVDIRDFG